MHRWVSDDGLITLRVASQVLAGHGPVFNIGERVESSTSAAWTWLLVAAGWLFPIALPSLPVELGLAAATGGLAVAMDATGRLWRSRPGASRLVPAADAAPGAPRRPPPHPASWPSWILSDGS